MLRKDAKHSRITFSDGKTPATLSSPTDPADPPPAGFFHITSARKNPTYIRRAEEIISLSLDVYDRARSSTGLSITVLTHATKPMGRLTRRGLPSTTRRADHPPHDRAGHLREQHRRAYRADRGPPCVTRDTHTNHATRRMPTARARVLPASFPLISFDPEFTIRNGDPLTNGPERLASAITLGFACLGLVLHLRRCVLIRKRDNPRIVERAARRNVFSFCVCAGQMHVVPYHVVRPTIVFRKRDALVSSAMSVPRLNGRVLGPILSPITGFIHDPRKKRPLLCGTGVKSQCCRLVCRSGANQPSASTRPSSSAFACSSTVTFSITTGSIGTSPYEPLFVVCTTRIASTTSMPLTTLPKTA